VVRGQDVKKPKVVTDYNSGTGGVDFGDVYLTSYHSSKKTLKTATITLEVVPFCMYALFLALLIFFKYILEVVFC
jgi:hypothetical protein